MRERVIRPDVGRQTDPSTPPTTEPTSAPTAPRTDLAGGSCRPCRLGPTGPSATHPAYKLTGAMSAREVDYLLIGGGLASANCARWLREEGAEGEVLLVGRELDPPYNRPRVLEGLHARGGDPRGADVPPPGVVEGAEDRAAHRDDRDRSRHGGAHGQALEQGGGPLRQGAAGERRQRPPPRRRGRSAREHLLPAHARQRRRDPSRRARTSRRSS